MAKWNLRKTYGWLKLPPKGVSPGWIHSTLQFLEHNFVILPPGIIGGIVAVIFPPLFTLLGACFLLGLHRSKVVAGKSRLAQWSSYVLLSIGCFVGLSILNGAIQKKLSDSNTALAKLVASFVPDRITKVEVPIVPNAVPSQHIPTAAEIAEEIRKREPSDTHSVPHPPQRSPKPEDATRMAILREAMFLSEHVGNLWIDYQAKRDRITNDYQEKAARVDAQTFKDHYSPFEEMEIQQARDYEVQRYKQNYMQRSIEVRHKIINDVPGIAEPSGFDEAYTDILLQNPNAVMLQSIADDLKVLAESYAKRYSLKP
jgi:hypothetical protein